MEDGGLLASYVAWITMEAVVGYGYGCMHFSSISGFLIP